MGYGRSDGWEDNNEVYSSHQVESVLDFCGVEVVSETGTHFLCYCPFHGNRVDPAFAADKARGLWTCFNPACGESGTLEQLVRRRKRLNAFQTMRLIQKYRVSNDSDAAERIAEAWKVVPNFVEFPQEPLNRMAQEFPLSPAHQYMTGRHFGDEVLMHFAVGYSPEKWVKSKKTGNMYLKPKMVIVPMHDPKGMPIGLVGRTIEGEKRFKNSDDLPKSKTMFNLHRAKKYGATVIIVESSFDVMRLHQAGYPNAVALLGGSLSPEHIQQLNRFFDTIIIMTDFDKADVKKPGTCKKCKTFECQGHRPGRDLGRAIVNALPNKKVMWACYDDECVFPYKPVEGYRDGPAKDPGDMTDDEIRQCLKNAISSYQYETWGIDENVLPWEMDSGIISSNSDV
jgi:hypothetical protein